MPQAPRDWPAEHRNGEWDYLASEDEQVRLAVIAGLAGSFACGTVVDLGCGAGHLAAWLSGTRFSHYVGVDIAAGAFPASPRGEVEACFVASDIVAFDPGTTVPGSAMVLSEVTYYLDQPGTQLARLAQVLDPACVILANTVPGPEHRVYANRIADCAETALRLGWALRAQVNLAGRSGWDGVAACWNITAWSRSNRLT